MIEDTLEGLVHTMLKEIGEDPGRDGLEGTPARVARSMRTFTEGYAQDPGQVLRGALFDVSYDEMVLVKDIDFYSLCEHHLLPFFGRVHVGYIPNGKVVGLSKLPRVVEIFARRLQVQERLTTQLAQTIEEVLGRGRRGRGDPPLHDDAGRGEAELVRDHELDAGRVPERLQDPIGVHGAHSPPQGIFRLTAVRKTSRNG
jgi:GTP cyclohydrolase I